MPPPFVRHVFVCTNRRPPESPKGCCASKGSDEVLSVFKRGVSSANLLGEVRAQQSGCLDACERGVAVVVYPEGYWYQGVTPADVPEIIEKHLIHGQPVERLKMVPYQKKSG